jgi:hypothetical protein
MFEFCNWRNDGATGQLGVPGRLGGRPTGRLAGAVDGLPDSDSQSDTPSLRLAWLHMISGPSLPVPVPVVSPRSDWPAAGRGSESGRPRAAAGPESAGTVVCR